MLSRNPYRLVALALSCVVIVFFVKTSFALNGSQNSPIQVYKAVAPIYPPIARAARASGVVKVNVMVDSAGAVISARGVNAHPLLRAVAENAAQRWQFAPDKEAAAERQASLSFTFTIMPECAKYADLTPIFTPPNQIEVRTDPPAIICDDCGPQPDPCKDVKR